MTLSALFTSNECVGHKWVFKTNVDSSIQNYKAHLVAKGFYQKLEFYLFETFSAVVKSTTTYVILTLAVTFNWHVQQIIFNNVYLNGDLHENIYTSQPMFLCYYFLGIEVRTFANGFYLSQSKCIKDSLNKTHKEGAKSCSTPMVTGKLLFCCLALNFFEAL